MVDLTPLSAESVLAQSTRSQLFALLGELKRPAGTVELAERLGRHPNGVRLHLERMQEVGLVTRSRAVQPMGRPRDAWAIAPDARPGGQAPSAYADLGRWLARAIPAGRGRLRQVEAVGREIGRETAPRASEASPEETMHTTLAALGLQPHRDPPQGGCVTYTLGNCPYRDAVRENQEVVCTLHRGLTRGLLDVIEPHAKLAGFVPSDPDVAGCLIKLEGVSTLALSTVGEDDA